MTKISAMILAVALALLASSAAPATAQATPEETTKKPKTGKRDCPDNRRALTYYRLQANRWHTLRGRQYALELRELAQPRGCPYVAHLVGKWRVRARNARESYERHQERLAERRAFNALYEKWRCIHENEGAWNANTGNGYYGGLQMDGSFQWAYGREFVQRWGTADRWPVWAQLTAAERAWRVRGFNPWPNTARMCGLL